MENIHVELTDARLRLSPITRCMTDLAIPVDNGYIAGGSTKDMLCALLGSCAIESIDKRMAANDVDVYCVKTADFEIIKKYLSNHPKLKHVEDRILTINFEYDDESGVKIPVQLIRPFEGFNEIRFCGDFTEVVECFDITLCRGAFFSAHSNCLLWYDYGMYESLKERSIKFHNIQHPLNALIRSSKYMSKGFHLNIEQYFNIMDLWDEIGKDQKEELKEIVNSLMEGDGNIEMEDYLFLSTVVGGMPIPIINILKSLPPEEREKELAKFRGDKVEEVLRNLSDPTDSIEENKNDIPF